MPQDLSPVGASATASKKAVSRDKGGNEEFDRKAGIRIREVDNGAVLLTIEMKKTGGGKNKSAYPEGYCPPKELAFESIDGALAKAQSVFGGGSSAPAASTPSGPPPAAPSAPPPSGPPTY